MMKPSGIYGPEINYNEKLKRTHRVPILLDVRYQLELWYTPETLGARDMFFIFPHVQTRVIA